MSKLINCYHIKKKHPQEIEDEDEEEDDQKEDENHNEKAATTKTFQANTKSNNCDINNNNDNNNNNNCSPPSDHHNDGGPRIGQRSPVASVAANRGPGAGLSTRRCGANLGRRLLALLLACLTLSCLRDDWLTWRWRQQQLLCMNTAQRTQKLASNLLEDYRYDDNGPANNQQHHSYECDDGPTMMMMMMGARHMSLFQLAEANVDANRLYEDLMMTYNRIVLPVQNNTDRVVVLLGLKLSQLIDVNLKNQMMTTNVWLNQEWIDYKLKWDPSEYGGIEDINLPAEQIWLPDIVLYNSAEGYFAVSIMTKAKVRYDGHVTWNPPAIFRSSCQIDITYFPFDSQNCHLKFGSWTFGTKIDLRHINDTEQSIEYGTDLSEYYQNVEWDIMRATAKRNVITYICCPNDFYPDVTFNFTLRRKPLFYTVNLILPCIGITILSFLVFYLPSDSGEKVTLTISILVSLIFFLCVLIETIPSTSTAMPLLGKYLVFTMILITLSVCATVGVLNIHFRTPSTHLMSPWAKRWCIEILPKYLFMNVPQYQSQPANSSPILPEQLIYPHNQAYQQSLITNWSALVQEAQKHQQQQAPSAAVASRDLRQQGGQGPLEHGTRPTMQLLDIGKLSHQSSAGSSFLPYLTSEAARRLQMQRSRSSERASSNNCDSATANGNHIGGGRPMTACDTPVSQSAERPASALGHLEAAQQANSSTGKSDKRSGAPFWRLFARDRSSTKTGQRIKLQQKQSQRKSSTDHHQTGAKWPAGQSGPVGSSSSTTSSSSESEHDYQHHNHFQARASVCSTNMWRIGPTRRCSLAATASGQIPNYPTFYRPSANLNSTTAAATNNNKQVRQVISTIGSNPRDSRQYLRAPHQQSSGDQFDSAGSSESPLMGGFKSSAGVLANWAAMRQAGPSTRTKAISHQMQHPGGLLPSLARRNLVYPVAGSANEQEMRQLSLGRPLGHSRQTLQAASSNLSAPVYSPQLQQPTPPPPLPPDMCIHGQQQPHLLQACRGPNQQPQQHLLARQNSNQSGRNQAASFETVASNTASSTTGTTVMVLGDRQQQQQQHHLGVQPHPHQYHHHQQEQQQQQQHCMTRSRSTDHRLCQYALASQPTNQPVNQRASGQRHTIGRALGQVYVQRLQRQPTIYSLQPMMQGINSASAGAQVRQGRSIYRNAALLQDPTITLRSAQSASQECIRRSRSQSSLSQQQQHLHRTIGPACRQCNQQQQYVLGCDGCGPDRMVSSNRPNTSSCYSAADCSKQPECNTLAAQHPAAGSQSASTINNRCKSPLTPLAFMKLISEVDKAIQNAMFIAQHIDNLDEFESVKENWKYIAMVIDRIFLIVFLFACIVGSTAIFMMVPWSHYTVDQPIDLQLVRSMSLNFTAGEPHPRSCRDDF